MSIARSFSSLSLALVLALSVGAYAMKPAQKTNPSKKYIEYINLELTDRFKQPFVLDKILNDMERHKQSLSDNIIPQSLSKKSITDSKQVAIEEEMHLDPNSSSYVDKKYQTELDILQRQLEKERLLATYAVTFEPGHYSSEDEDPELLKEELEEIKIQLRENEEGLLKLQQTNTSPEQSQKLNELNTVIKELKERQETILNILRRIR